MKIRHAVGATHAGTREHNEDAVLRLGKIPLFAVADGMGGPGAGEVAASIALEVLKKHGASIRRINKKVAQDRTTANRLALSTCLDTVFNEASREIAQEATHLGVPGMGSTLLMVTVIDNFAYIGHVGDCRAYILREGRILRLTEDHTVAEFRLRRGKISREEYQTSPDRQVLYQALGAGAEVDVDLAEVRLADNDVLLLCSDGLPRAVAEDDIAARIELDDLGASVRRLITDAVEAGAPDNVSAVLIGVEGEQGDEPIQAVTGVMSRVFLFQKLTQQERLVIAPYLEEIVYEKGADIISEGDSGELFYVVVSGRVKVTRDGTRLVEIAEGGHFGELALARQTRRSATVTAMRPTRLLSLSRERFHELVQHKPELGARLALALLDAVGDRLRDLTDRLNAVERAVRGELKWKRP